MAKKERIGRILFLEQLEYMVDDKVVNWPSEANEDLCVMYAEMLEVPEHLQEEFNAYCLEYIMNGGSAVHPEGAFKNEEPKDGIYDKIYYFYRPIFNYIEDETGAQIMLCIETDYDRSHIAATVKYYKEKGNNKEKELALPFVAYLAFFKPWWPFVKKPEAPEQLPEKVYETLEEIYNKAKEAIVNGLHANGISISNGAVKNQKFAGILVRYTGVSGESEFACLTLLPYRKNVPPEKAVHKYFSDFFGKGTQQENERWYFSEDNCQAVKVEGWRLVPQADYEVLKKYVW